MKNSGVARINFSITYGGPKSTFQIMINKFRLFIAGTKNQDFLAIMSVILHPLHCLQPAPIHHQNNNLRKLLTPIMAPSKTPWFWRFFAFSRKTKEIFRRYFFDLMNIPKVSIFGLFSSFSNGKLFQSRFMIYQK